MRVIALVNATMLATLMAGAAVAEVPAANATEISVAWTGDSIVGTQVTIPVTPFYAGTFLGTTGSGTFAKGPGALQAPSLSVEIGGTFVTISQGPWDTNGDLNSLLPASTFTAGTIDAIQLTDAGFSGGTAGLTDSECQFLALASRI